MASVSALSYDIPPKGYWKTAIDHRLQLHGSSKQSKGVNVVADNLVEVQVISELTVGWRSKGSYMSLPVELLSDDYVIATLCELNNCFCAIVLTQDGTDVSISLRVPTGDAVVYEGVTYGNDDVITASGDRGDVIQVTCYECDLSGTRVRSSHDIAVIAGDDSTDSIYHIVSRPKGSEDEAVPL
nr:hypothetical protein BaRGS_003865 [Batillaria attramentaria]